MLVDLVRFRWTGWSDDQDEGDLSAHRACHGWDNLHTPATIRVGMKPDNVAGEQAHHAAMEGLGYSSNATLPSLNVDPQTGEQQWHPY